MRLGSGRHKVKAKRTAARWLHLERMGLRWWELPRVAAIAHRRWCYKLGVSKTHQRADLDDLTQAAAERMVRVVRDRDSLYKYNANQHAAYLLRAMRWQLRNDAEKLRRQPEGNLDLR